MWLNLMDENNLYTSPKNKDKICIRVTHSLKLFFVNQPPNMTFCYIVSYVYVFVNVKKHSLVIFFYLKSFKATINNYAGKILFNVKTKHYRMTQVKAFIPGLHLPALPFLCMAELLEIQLFCNWEQFVSASNVISFTFPKKQLVFIYGRYCLYK